MLRIIFFLPCTIFQIAYSFMARVKIHFHENSQIKFAKIPQKDFWTGKLNHNSPNFSKKNSNSILKKTVKYHTNYTPNISEWIKFSLFFFPLNFSWEKTNKRQHIITFTFKLNRNSQNIERGAMNSEQIIVEHHPSVTRIHIYSDVTHNCIGIGTWMLCICLSPGRNLSACVSVKCYACICVWRDHNTTTFTSYY